MSVLESVRRAVEQRAAFRCEYCRAPQRICGYRFHVEHIIPRSQGGVDSLSNLALACGPCNFAKGARTHSSDPETDLLTPLFHPRTQRWEDHFVWDDDYRGISGLSPMGRATVIALDLNAPLRREARALWRDLGLLS